MMKKLTIIVLLTLIITNVFAFGALPIQAHADSGCITIPANLQGSVGSSVLSRLCSGSITNSSYYSSASTIPGCFAGYLFSTVTGQSCTGNNYTYPNYTYPYVSNGLNTINISAPTRLAVGTLGTWIITVNSANSTYTNYTNYGSASVRWGDEGSYYYTNNNVTTPTVTSLQGQQVSTFTHTYQTAGTYTVTFTTTDPSGIQNTATVTVVVSGNNYGGGYGQPVISYISPSSTYAGSQIMIQGSGFSSYGNTVHFGVGGTSNLSSVNGSTIYYTIPRFVSPCDINSNNGVCTAYATQVVPGMTYPIYVTTPSGTSNTLYFTVTQ